MSLSNNTTCQKLGLNLCTCHYITHTWVISQGCQNWGQILAFCLDLWRGPSSCPLHPSGGLDPHAPQRKGSQGLPYEEAKKKVEATWGEAGTTLRRRKQHYTTPNTLCHKHPFLLAYTGIMVTGTWEFTAWRLLERQSEKKLFFFGFISWGIL